MTSSSPAVESEGTVAELLRRRRKTWRSMGSPLEDLVKRFRDLEASQARLRDQLQWVLEEEERGDHARGRGHGHAAIRREGGEFGVLVPGRFVHGPYRNVLKYMGHAVHISRPHTGEIFFWNQSAENLYGWRDYEALGKRVRDLLMHEESNPNLMNVMERLNKGQPWSGQLAFKKRSGEMFMAMVTESPLYEDGAFIGVITVSSDAALLNDKYSETFGGYPDQVHGQPRASKRVQWCQQPQIASSVSNLASKVFSRNRSSGSNDSEHETLQEGYECIPGDGSAKPKKEVPASETALIIKSQVRGDLKL